MYSHTPQYVRSITVSTPSINGWYNLIGGICCKPYSIFLYGFQYDKCIFNTQTYNIHDIFYLLSLPVTNQNISLFNMLNLCKYNDPFFCFTDLSKTQRISVDSLKLTSPTNTTQLDSSVLNTIDSSNFIIAITNPMLHHTLSLNLVGLNKVEKWFVTLSNKRLRTKFNKLASFELNLILTYLNLPNYFHTVDLSLI